MDGGYELPANYRTSALECSRCEYCCPVYRGDCLGQRFPQCRWYVRLCSEAHAGAVRSDGWDDGNVLYSTRHDIYDRQARVPTVGVGAQSVVKRASFRRNEDCTFSGEISTTNSKAKHSTKTYRSGPYTREVQVYRNFADPMVYDSLGACNSARNSFQINEDGTYSGSAERSTFDNATWQKDSQEKTWYSEVTQNGTTYKYKHTLRLFRGMDYIPTPSSTKNGSISVSFDECGRFQGQYHTTDLVGVSGGSASGGVYGGQKTGSIRIKNAGKQRTKTGERYDVVVTIEIFYGSGNEGSELNAISKQVLVPGLHISSNDRFRVYATGSYEDTPR